MANQRLKNGWAVLFALVFVSAGAKAQNAILLTPSVDGHVQINIGIQEPQKRQPEDLELNFPIQLTPPSPERLFRFESEQKLRDRIRQELKDVRKVEFPPSDEITLSSQRTPRIWPFLVATSEPNTFCYKRPWFEQKNFERYGWDLGILQPFVSTGVFYTDLALLPLHWMTDPLRCQECSAGECLPGDRVPLLWIPAISK